MIEYKSIGFVDVSCGRIVTERFVIYIDGVDVGAKDIYWDGRLFCINDSGNLSFRPPYCEYYIDCPDEFISKVHEKFGGIDTSEGPYVCLDNKARVDDCNIEDVYYYIQLLIRRQKKHEKRMARSASESPVCD